MLGIAYCPRCDRPFNLTKKGLEALDQLKEHVANQHPDYDPEWYDTYPESEETSK